MLVERRQRWPPAIDQPTLRPEPLENAAATVTFIGHATLLIQTATCNILTDPMYSLRAGPLNVAGPRRVRQPGVAFDDLPAISVVLLSHNHYDHCDLATLRRLARRFDPVVVTPLGNGGLVHSAGVRRVEELDWWQHLEVAGAAVTLTPAFHFSARGVLDRNRALWGGFVSTVGHRRIFFAGDTAYGPFFREIAQRLGPIDLALLPIGAYEPRWFMQAVHMNPAEAVDAHIDLRASKSIGIHFGTFPMAAEGFDDPVRGLDEVREARGIPPGEFSTLALGESIRLGQALEALQGGRWIDGGCRRSAPAKRG